jgi:predicted HTH transcriptional regulator
MRIYRDVELVEQLGSGVPRILQAYGKSCFRFTQNFLRITFPAAVPVKNVPTPQATPQVTPQATPQATPQVKRLLKHLTKEKSRDELQEVLGITDRKYFRRNYLQPALSEELIERSIPDKPQSPKQTYRLTEKGRLLAGHD